jgi:2-(1,2-epoxy-1,2-dihydrophenyl)acetyl-CoA isomerase
MACVIRPGAGMVRVMSASERVQLDVADGLAHLRLVWVQGHNAIDPAMTEGLRDAVDAIARDERVRAVLITADGPSFTVGGDLGHFMTNLDRLPDEMESMISGYHATLATLEALPVPIVCAAQGPTAGGGLGLLWAADIVLVADTVTIAAGFPRLALSGDGGSSWALPRLVGLRRAQEFIIGGRVLGAAEAVEWGIASEVVPAAALPARALEEGRRLASGPTVAYGQMRRLLRDSMGNTWAQQLQSERVAMKLTGATGDAREGITSFAERRDPVFTGS